MLKPIVRSSDPVLQPVDVNVVVSEPKEDLGSELISNSFGPIDMTRLTNADVLQNLDSKLCHLTEGQHQDLEKLLLEIECLFADLLTGMDQLCDDVKVRGATSCKQYPSKQQYFKEVMT